MKHRVWIPLLLIVIVLTQSISNHVLAQDRSLVWRRYDVDIDAQQNGDLLVKETQQIDFMGGPYRFGFAAIPLDRVENISDIRVSEVINGQERQYRPNSTGEYGFTTQRVDGNLEITWYFPSTSDSEHIFILRYRANGAIRVYEGGDQIWWKAIPPDHNFPIENATVTVMPPQTFAKDQLLVESYGAALSGDPSYTDRGAVVFNAQNIPANQELEVRVQFPSGVVQAEPPAWQAADDQVRTWGPVVGVLSGALGLILLIGGPVAVYLLWYSRGRDEPAPVMAEYITEPPSDLPASLVGTLVDEHAEVKDIIAGILDLAKRGAIRLEEQQKDALMGFGVSREFIFHLEDSAKAAYPYEEQLLQKIFGTNYKYNERNLRDLRNKFYSVIPSLQEMLYKEVADRGYFHTNPNSVRTRWRALAIFGLIISAGVSFCLISLLGQYSLAAACPGAGLAATMLALIVVSRHMPRKTAKGAEEAAKWLAFRKYLQNIEEYADLESIKSKFEQYLPYAMAFGLQDRLISQFSAIDAPAPSWWGPVIPHPRGYYGGPIIGGPSAGGPSGGPPGPLAGDEGGMPSLSGMSESIGTSLSSMSAGLGTLLSSASSTLTSQPAPKRSSGGGFGGGSFSGGGSFGGGGGGGGSRGFG